MILSLLRNHQRSGARRRWLGTGSFSTTRPAENSSKKALDSLLTLQPIGGRQHEGRVTLMKVYVP